MFAYYLLPCEKKCVIATVNFKLMDCKIYSDPGAMIENIKLYVLWLWFPYII